MYICVKYINETKDVFNVFSAGSGHLFNVNWWKCNPIGTSLNAEIAELAIRVI